MVEIAAAEIAKVDMKVEPEWADRHVTSSPFNYIFNFVSVLSSSAVN